MARKDYKDEITAQEQYKITNASGVTIPGFEEVVFTRVDTPSQEGDSFLATDANQISDLIEYIPVTVDGTITTQINVTTYSENKIIPIELTELVTGGAITISRNGGTAYPLYSDYALTEAVEELEAGIYTFNTRTSAFQLASSGGATIKSIQRGYYNMTFGVNNANITVDSVDMSKSIVMITSIPGSSKGEDAWIEAKLTTSSNINFSRFGTSDSVAIEWQLVEYESATVQRGEVSLTATSTDILISSVDLLKAIVFVYWKSDNSSAMGASMTNPNLTTSTNLNIFTPSTFTYNVVAWQVIEFD